MKFSHKLFKIQAKMSLTVFILMGSVCHLGALEGELSSRDEFSNGDEIRSRSTWRVRYDEKHADDSSDKVDESVQDELASSPNAVPVRSVVKKSLARVLAEFRRNEEVDSSNAKNLQFRQRLLDRAARNAAGRGEQRRVSQSSFGHREVLNDPVTGSPIVHFGFEDQYNPHLKIGFSSPGDMSDTVNPQEGVSSRKKTSLHKSPRSPLEQVIDSVLDAAIERNSPKKSPVRKMQYEDEIIEAESMSPQSSKKSPGSAGLNTHRSPVYEAVGRNLLAAVKYDGMRLEPDEGALVTYGATRPVYEVERQLERVQKSKRELQLLHEKSLADEAALANAKPVDITQTNQDLKYGVRLEEYEATPLEERPKFIKKLVKFYNGKPGFEGVTKDNVLDLLRSKMVGAMTRAHATMTQLCSAENASANSDKASKKKIIQAAEQGLSVIDTLEDVASKLIEEREAINSELALRVYRDDVLTVLTGNNVVGSSTDLKRMDPMALLEIIANQYLQSTRTIGNMSRAAELQAEKSVQDGNIIKELLAQKKAQDESMKALIENNNRMTVMLQESMRKGGSSAPQVSTERNNDLASRIGDLTLTTRKDNPLAKTGRARTQYGTSNSGGATVDMNHFKDGKSITTGKPATGANGKSVFK